MRLNITPSDQLLHRYGNQLGALGEKDGHKALARAINRTTDTVFNKVARAVSRQSSIKLVTVKANMNKGKVKPGGMGELVGIVSARGDPIPLKEFNAKQFSYGVKAKIWGKQRRFEGLFIYGGHYRSGKEAGNGHVFQNTRAHNSRSGRDNAIAKQSGPSVPTEMVRGQAKQEFENTVASVLPDRVAHELNRLLGK